MLTEIPIADAVALAVAPIFLMTGIGALLNVMTQRLGRVIDRARALEIALEQEMAPETAERHRTELGQLGARINSANRAILATVVSALLVCIVVALLFIEQLTPIDMSAEVAVLFIATMGLLITGLGFFLHEISVATGSLKVRSDLLR